ncbi:MAG: class I SAM-dependent rRNA methyltransferase, partial [Clostridiales bacterium]|nr:class I SAM-dependent rRNA methyltransferase [Clostridiales bacterium]
REEIDRDFFLRRVCEAWEYRVKLGCTDLCRAVFAEADMLPAFIVDKYGEYLSIQTLSRFMDDRKDMLCDILREVMAPKGIYERNDVQVREKEGLEQKKGFIGEPFNTDVIVNENGLLISVDIANGQKTGYFLDQRENRAALKEYTGDMVLDCFCHTGGFGLHSAMYGAKDVECVDISAQALEAVRRNALLNRMGDIVRTTKDDVFELLRRYVREGRQYDTVILDPPAFCKTKSAVAGAARGYKDINMYGMQLVRKGGFLITCSCSHYMTERLFMKLLRDASIDCRRDCRIMEIRGQCRDHPVPLYDSESSYLKCVILQVN